MSKTVGFIGAGNMGKAILKGILSVGQTTPEEIFVYDSHQPNLESIHRELGVSITSNENEVAQKASIIILAVKPNAINEVLNKVKDDITKDKIVVSIAAGTSIEQLSANLPSETKIVRVMPNTPALVGYGMSAISCNSYLTEDEKQEILSIFNSFGKAELVSESLMDAVTGLSGSGPAYVYLFIEALADGAVVEGMPRESAYKFAAQTVLGAAQMVLQTGKHPGELKDMVSSPGGTTIAAVKSLENDGFRSAVINAVNASAEKSRNM
jgi:pyrroline-5-carboxylate reductase